MDRRTFLGSVPASAGVASLSRLARAVDGASSVASPYAAAARKYVAVLLAHGRDHYGPVHTPMFVKMIDLRTLEIPQQRTVAEWRAEMSTWKEDRDYLMWGKDRSSVLWAQDSNLLWDTENVRLMYALTAESGERQYAAAADDYIRYFLRHCVSRTTGFFAWGEHIAYNVVDDQIHGERHELQHPAPLWPEMWRFDPDAVRNEIEAIYLYHITDKRSMAYDRHANYWNGLPERDQATIMGYAGVYIDSFAFLYKQTGEAKYMDWARKLLLSFQSKSNSRGLYPDNWTDRQKREEPYQFPTRPELAAAMYKAFQITRDPRWRDDADRYLDACEQSFRTGRAAGNERVFVAVRSSEAALLAYQFGGRPAHLEMAMRAGEEQLQRPQPHAQMASTLADSINSLRQLYEVTGERRWLDGARKLGDFALQNFVHPSGLIRGTAVVDRPDYYDAIQGSGALAWALYQLGGVKEAVAPATPIRLLGDTTAPEIADLKFPPLAFNDQRIPVNVRISDPSGIKHAALLYAYGNEVGFEDRQPEIAGDRYTFHINPAGMAFLGEILFAVEAVDASPNANRAMTLWQKLRLAASAQASVTNRSLKLPKLGVELTEVEAFGLVGASVTAAPPEGIAAPPAGWVSTGRYITFQRADLNAEGIALRYAPEETERLIESTLVLAYWDGADWQRVASGLDREARTVSGPFHASPHWTLVGEDRVLWRAPGRQGGTALADVDGDGKREVVTVQWQPGEMLSSTGQPLRQFPIDNPTHPLANPSPPSVARLSPGGEPLILFGAPAGYVYAYDRNGKLHWRTEVGGEIIDGVAVGRITAGQDSSVVASWEGGVAAIDAQGRTLWQKDVPAPRGANPVLVDLDGDGRLEVVLNAGAGIVALKGDTGAVLWQYTVPGAQFVTPAAGEFVRGGKPRIITADEAETVYALDENGRLIWRQDHIYGPWEVPEQIEQYAEACELGLADLEGQGERQVVVTMKSGDTLGLTARGERLWRFVSHERKVGTSLARGGHLGFADMDGDGKLEVIVSQQDSYVYVLDGQGRPKWTYRAYFWYHSTPSIADLQNNGELNIVFTCPEEGGTYALRGGFKGEPGRAPWPMDRGNLARTNCAPWQRKAGGTA